MIQIKIFNNGSKIFIKSVSDFVISKKELSIFSEHDTNISLAVFSRKIKLTAYPDRFTILRVISDQVFKFGIFIQVYYIVSLSLIVFNIITILRFISNILKSWPFHYGLMKIFLNMRLTTFTYYFFSFWEHVYSIFLKRY